MDSGFVLLACAAHSFGFGLFHLGFWKLFDWPRTLRQTTLPNRAIIQIANIQLAWMFLAAGVICVLFRAELASTALGRTWLASMSAFWMLRLSWNPACPRPTEAQRCWKLPWSSRVQSCICISLSLRRH